MKVLKFYATWCEPCKMLTRIMEQAKDKINIPVQEVNIEEEMELAQKYRVRSVPTMVMVAEDGTELKRQSGMLMEDKLLEFLS